MAIPSRVRRPHAWQATRRQVDYRLQTGYTNDTGAAQTVLVAVDSTSTFNDEDYGLFVEILAPQCVFGTTPSQCLNGQILSCNDFNLFDTYDCAPGGCNAAGDGCANASGNACFDAIPLDPIGGQLLDQPFSGSNEFSLNAGQTSGCFVDDFDENTGPDTFYRVDLLAGETLTVDLTSRTSSAYLFLLDGCDASACLQNNPLQGSASLNYYAVVSENDLRSGRHGSLLDRLHLRPKLVRDGQHGVRAGWLPLPRREHARRVLLGRPERDAHLLCGRL